MYKEIKFKLTHARLFNVLSLAFSKFCTLGFISFYSIIVSSKLILSFKEFVSTSIADLYVILFCCTYVYM